MESHSRQSHAVQPPPLSGGYRQPKDFTKPLTCYFWHHNRGCNKSSDDCAYAHYDTGIVADAPVHIAKRGIVAGGNAFRAVTQEALNQKEKELFAREMHMNEWYSAAMAEMVAKDMTIADLRRQVAAQVQSSGTVPERHASRPTEEASPGDESCEATIDQAETQAVMRNIVEGAIRIVEVHRTTVRNLTTQDGVEVSAREQYVVQLASNAMGEVLTCLEAVQDAVNEEDEASGNNGEQHASTTPQTG